MFEGRTYTQNSGYKGWGIRFSDHDGGVATTAYSYKLSEAERFEMARRITAALNFTRNMRVEQLEADIDGVDQRAKIAALQARVRDLEGQLARAMEAAN